MDMPHALSVTPEARTIQEIANTARTKPVSRCLMHFPSDKTGNTRRLD